MEKQKTNIVYTGRVQLRGGKVGHAYQLTNEAGELTGKRISFAKKLLEVSVGGIINVVVTEDGVEGKRAYAGQWKDKEAVGAWRAADEMLAREQDLKKQMSSVPANTYAEAMGMLKNIVSGLPRTQRQLFITKVCYELAKVG